MYDYGLTVDRTKRTVSHMSQQTSSPSSVIELIDSFDTIRAFSEAVGCGYEAARKMRDRGSIAPENWPAVVAAAESAGIEGVTLEWLSSTRRKRRSS